MDQNFQSQVRTAPTINSNSIILKTILSKTVRIEKNLKDRIKGQITTQRAEKQDKKKLKDILKEEDKKKKLSKPKLFQKVKNVTPKTGIIDSITNFLVFTFFGWFFTNTQKHLPKLLGIVNLLKGATDGIGWLTRGILDALSAFIGAGYKVYDTIKGKTDEIKSKPVQEKFDSVTKALDDNFNDLLKFFNDVNSIAEKVPQKPSPNNTPSSLPVKGAASGAYIAPTRGGSPTNKPVSRQLKTPSIPKKPKKTNIPEGRIGKDVGGEKVIREFYGSPKVGVNNIRPKGGPIRKTPVDVVSNISKTLKGRNSLFGDISSIGSEVAMGKRPNKDVYRNAAKDVVYLAQFIANNQQDQLKSAVLGMATGGRVTPISRQKINQANIVDLVENVIRTSVEKRVSEALNSLRSPMSFVRNQAQKNRGGFGRPDVSFDANGTPYFDGGYGMPGGGYGAPGGGYSAPGGVYGMPGGGYGAPGGPIVSPITMNGLSDQDVDALGRMIQAESRNQSAEGKASVMNVILNRYRLARAGKGYLPRGKNKNNVTVRDILFDINSDGTYQFSPFKDGSFQATSSAAGRRALQQAISAGGNDPAKLKQRLKSKYGLNDQDANYVIVSSAFSNARDRESRPFNTREIPVGDHSFQESPYARLNAPGQRIDANNLGNMERVIVKGGIIPSKTYISSFVGMRNHPITGEWKMHAGNDYALPENTPISIIKPGVVTRTGDLGGYGLGVEITHTDGTKSFYAHLNGINVNLNQRVKAGQVIGKVGSTGLSSGPHLHFEYNDRNGELVTDPSSLTSIADGVLVIM
jgi:murein DD-endopeptidase MepM/ murein hydrolase activator NlpD